MALANSESDIQRAAADVLGKMGPSAMTAIPHLVKALLNGNEGVRRATADALTKIDPQWHKSESGVSVISDFVRALADKENVTHRAAVADALGVLLGPTAVPYLVKVLVDRSGTVCLTIVDTLGKMGPSAMTAVPHLVKMLENSSDGFVRMVIKKSLDKIDPTGELQEQAWKQFKPSKT